MKTAHASDILRAVTMYKHGGIYLDLDCMVIKEFKGLKNTLAYEYSDLRAVNVAVLIFDKGHAFFNDILLELLHRSL